MMRRSAALALVVALGTGALASSGVARAQGGLLLDIEIRRDNPDPKRPGAAINTLQDLMRALASCWSFPPLDQSHQQVDVIFQVSFKRSGELFGKPRIVHFSRDVTPEERQRYYTLVAEAIGRCSPMPFTDSMGGAVAGRTLRIKLIDARNRKQAEGSWLTTKS
jgi:hypothetical protein